MKLRLEKLDPNGGLSLCRISYVGAVGLSALMILPILAGSCIDYLGFGEDTAGLPDSIFAGYPSNLAGNDD